MLFICMISIIPMLYFIWNANSCNTMPNYKIAYHHAHKKCFLLSYKKFIFYYIMLLWSYIFIMSMILYIFVMFWFCTYLLCLCTYLYYVYYSVHVCRICRLWFCANYNYMCSISVNWFVLLIYYFTFGIFVCKYKII